MHSSVHKGDDHTTTTDLGCLSHDNHMTYDAGHMTDDAGHMTYDAGHMTCTTQSATLDGWNIPVELHPAKDGQHGQEKAEERVYENIVIARKTNPDELYI